MHFICRINREIYSCITNDIATDEVIITDVQIQHIKERHPNDYERFSKYLPYIVSDPDYILRGNRPNTAFLLKTFCVKDENFQLILRLKTSKDIDSYKNSIITFLKINDRKLEKYLRNKEILYIRKDSEV